MLNNFMIKVPNNKKQTIEFDRETGNTLWWDTMSQNMKNIRPTFEPWEKPEGDIPPGYQEIKCHLIFDIKMGEKFCQKSRFVAGGHMTETPTTLTYASAVLRDLVRIALNIADINGTEILSCDIQNKYLTAEFQEKIWTRAGPEFESEAGTIMIVKMALYGLKSSGAEFRAHLAKTLNDFWFLSTNADCDIWYRPAVKTTGFEYYENILCYIDDILCTYNDPGIATRQIHAVFKFKGDNMEQPKIYLRAQVRKMIVERAEGWYMSVDKYVSAAVENVEQNIAKSNQHFPTCCKNPIMSGYWPETDTSPELKYEGVTQYQDMVRVLR